MKAVFVLAGPQFTLYSLVVDGRSDYEEFKDTWKQHNPAEWARMFRRLERLGFVGASRRENQYRDLGHGIFEAKTAGGLRVLFFYGRGGVILLSHGYLKQRRKAPIGQIEHAKRLKTRFEVAQESGELVWVDEQGRESRTHG